MKVTFPQQYQNGLYQVRTKVTLDNNCMLAHEVQSVTTVRPKSDIWTSNSEFEINQV